MNLLKYVKSKLRLIYSSKMTFLIVLLQILFLIVYIEINKPNSILNYVSILKLDFFLWIIYIPILVVIHKVSVFSTYYNCLSRVESKQREMIVDYIVIAISTSIINGLVLLVPTIFMSLFHNAIFSKEIIVNLLFFLLRYYILGLFVQYLIYSILFIFPKLQKHSNYICIIPIILFLIFTFPLELLTANNIYISISDFTGGKNYIFTLENGIVLWDSIFFYNAHLIGYLIVFLWISIDYVSRKMEFLENEDKDA